MTGRLRPGGRRRAAIAIAGAVLAVIAGAACGGQANQGAQSAIPLSGPLGSWTPPVPQPLSPITDYRSAVSVAIADHLRVWIEADLVKRWEEGPTWFSAAIGRVAALADRPGVTGIKIADELGYNDGMNSAAKIRKFLSAAAQALHAAAAHKLILVDMVVPQLGCLPGRQRPGSPEAACASQQQRAYPQLAPSDVDGYLRLHAIDVLDLSTYLQPDGTYASWGTTAPAAQLAAWQEVRDRGWPALVRLQARKALAHPGSYPGTAADAAAEVRTYVEIPLGNGARGADIWTWRQEYQGEIYRLLNPGMQDNALWDQLAQLRRSRAALFTHFSPHFVESGVRSDLAMIATVFTDVFLPAGTG